MLGVAFLNFFGMSILIQFSWRSLLSIFFWEGGVMERLEVNPSNRVKIRKKIMSDLFGSFLENFKVYVQLKMKRLLGLRLLLDTSISENH